MAKPPYRSQQDGCFLCFKLHGSSFMPFSRHSHSCHSFPFVYLCRVLSAFLQIAQVPSFSGGFLSPICRGCSRVSRGALSRGAPAQFCLGKEHRAEKSFPRRLPKRFSAP